MYTPASLTRPWIEKIWALQTKNTGNYFWSLPPLAIAGFWLAPSMIVCRFLPWELETVFRQNQSKPPVFWLQDVTHFRGCKAIKHIWRNSCKGWLRVVFSWLCFFLFFDLTIIAGQILIFLSKFFILSHCSVCIQFCLFVTVVDAPGDQRFTFLSNTAMDLDEIQRAWIAVVGSCFDNTYQMCTIVKPTILVGFGDCTLDSVSRQQIPCLRWTRRRHFFPVCFNFVKLLIFWTLHLLTQLSKLPCQLFLWSFIRPAEE